MRVVQSRGTKWTGHPARMGEMRNVYKILVEKAEGKRLHGRSRRVWEDNIKTHIREIGCVNMDWIHLAQVRVQLVAPVNTVVNIRVP
jgi:hypothetical protein